MLRILYFEILRRSVVVAFALILLDGVPAFAREELTLYSDHSAILTLPKPPGTIVVGNPSIADVTLDGDRVLLHGRNFGNTNVTILDQSGTILRDYDIYVTLQEANIATVFKNGGRASYSCTPNCQPMLTVGDMFKPHFSELSDAIKKKTTISTGQPTSGEAPQQVIIPAPLTE